MQINVASTAFTSQQPLTASHLRPRLQLPIVPESAIVAAVAGGNAVTNSGAPSSLPESSGWLLSVFELQASITLQAQNDQM